MLWPQVIELLESQNAHHGLYFYLGARIAFSEDPEEHYKYIEAAARTGNVRCTFACVVLCCWLLACAVHPCLCTGNVRDTCI